MGVSATEVKPGKNWQADGFPARMYSRRPDGTVQCHLSPRNCVIKEGKQGFCGVRVNRGGELVTLNYGKSVAMTEESIETEAVYHYAPGARILSMGNIGCMMHCSYCHNWKTSQAKYVTDDQVHRYTPEKVVEEALARGIQVISWTYNDPVVWQEFVLDTAYLAQKEGIINLYKSAFYISLEGASELADVIDIFSVSVKSMNEDFYRKITTGRLQPVLDATKLVHQRGRHLEISNLMVTDLNDSEEEALKIADWILDDLGDPDVPLHYVRFHPDYRYTHVPRTPVDRLERARENALARGIRYCYLGNVYDNPAVNSYCPSCGELVVERYGLAAKPIGLTPNAKCTSCGEKLPFKMIAKPAAARVQTVEPPESERERDPHLWRGDIKAVHLEIHNTEDVPRMVRVHIMGGERDGAVLREVPILPQSHFRFIVCKAAPDDVGVSVEHPRGVVMKYFEVYDRAHFPTVSVEEARPESDAVPAPTFVPASALKRVAPVG